MRRIERNGVLWLVADMRNKYSDINVSETQQEELGHSVDLEGATNGFLSEVFHVLTGERVEVFGEPEERFACPCCERRTLTEIYDVAEGTGYDICGFCGWEDDGTTALDVVSSVNNASIAHRRDEIRSLSNIYFRERWPRA